MNSPIDITNVQLFLLSLPAGGVGIYLVAQAIKKIFGMNSGKAIHLMVSLVSLLFAGAAYILKFKGLPLEVLGVSGPAMYGFSQWLYKAAQYVAEFAPGVTGSLSKISSLMNKRTPAVAAHGAVPAMDVPADVAANPAPIAPGTNEVNF